MQHELAKLENQLSILLTECREASSKHEALAKKHNRLKKKINTIKCNNIFKEGLSLDNIMSSDTGNITDKYYDLICNWWYENFTYCGKDGGAQFCNNQYVIKTMFRKNEPFEPQRNEILQVLPYINYATTEGKDYPYSHINGKRDGKFKYISIFEYNLNRYGSYHLEIYDDGICVIAKSYCIDFEGTLEDCLKYIHKNLFYELSRSNDV